MKGEQGIYRFKWSGQERYHLSKKKNPKLGRLGSSVG